MKKLYTWLLLALLLAGAGCQQSGDVKAVLQDENDRKALYAAILEDEALHDEMLAMMRDRNAIGPTGQGGIITDSAEMAHMNLRQMQTHMQQMMMLCDRDTAVCSKMSQLMMQHQGMRNSILQSLHQQGTIDADCLQQMKQQPNR